MYYLKLFVDLTTQQKLEKLESQEKVNYREISSIENVIEEQVIGELVSPDVLNEKEKKELLKIDNVEELKKFLGDGVYIKPNEPARIYSNKSGQILFKDGKFYVNDKLYLDEISFKTGNVIFAGDVYIKGNVKPGFTVNAKNIFVEGNVDNAQLIAGEKVIVKGGIIGLQNSDFCRIRAGKIIIIDFVENSDIECRGPVYIKKTSMHTNIYAKERITIYGEPGLVVGGELLSRKNILVKIAGSKWGTKTIFKIGIDPEKYLRLKHSESNLNKSKNLLNELDKSISYIKSVLDGEQSSTKDKDELKEELKEINLKRETLIKRITRLEKIIEKLKNEIELEKDRLNLNDTAIYVFEKIHPGVEFRIGLEHIKVNDEMNGCIVALDNEKVIFNPLN